MLSPLTSLKPLNIRTPLQLAQACFSFKNVFVNLLVFRDAVKNWLQHCREWCQSLPMLCVAQPSYISQHLILEYYCVSQIIDRNSANVSQIIDSNYTNII